MNQRIIEVSYSDRRINEKSASTNMYLIVFLCAHNLQQVSNPMCLSLISVKHILMLRRCCVWTKQKKNLFLSCKEKEKKKILCFSLGRTKRRITICEIFLVLFQFWQKKKKKNHSYMFVRIRFVMNIIFLSFSSHNFGWCSAS